MSEDNKPNLHPLSELPPEFQSIVTNAETKREPLSIPSTNGDRPGDIWAEQIDWHTLLETDGATFHSKAVENGIEYELWTRPGKDKRDGASASLNYRNGNVLKVFTSNWPGLDVEATYTKFGYIAATRFHGDHSACARELRERGFHASDPIEWLSATHAKPSTEQPNNPTDQSPLHSGLVDWQMFWSKDWEAENWLVPGFLAKGRSHAIYATAKTGKSLFTLYMVAHAAVELGIKILYIDLEMTHADLYERLNAFGYNENYDLSNLFYFAMHQMPFLDTREGGAELLRFVNELGVEAVIIDTTARTISGPEDKSDTIAAWNHYTGGPLKAAGITVARIDHAGKELDKGQRGSSAKNDDVDIVVQLSKRDESSWHLKATHRRIGWYPEEQNIAIQESNGVMRFVQPQETWPAGTHECADNLDRLGADVNITKRAAEKLLRENGQGTRSLIVNAALRYRRDRAVTGFDPEPSHRTNDFL